MSIKNIQDDTSHCSIGSVDMKIKVVFQHMLLLLQGFRVKDRLSCVFAAVKEPTKARKPFLDSKNPVKRNF